MKQDLKKIIKYHIFCNFFLILQVNTLACQSENN